MPLNHPLSCLFQQHAHTLHVYERLIGHLCCSCRILRCLLSLVGRCEVRSKGSRRVFIESRSQVRGLSAEELETACEVEAFVPSLLALLLEVAHRFRLLLLARRYDILLKLCKMHFFS
jgi:hypothetical protein